METEEDWGVFSGDIEAIPCSPAIHVSRHKRLAHVPGTHSPQTYVQAHLCTHQTVWSCLCLGPREASPELLVGTPSLGGQICSSEVKMATHSESAWPGIPRPGQELKSKCVVCVCVWGECVCTHVCACTCVHSRVWCMCVHVCTHVCGVYACVCMCTSVWCMCTRVWCMHVYTCALVWCMHAYVCVHLYARVCACVYTVTSHNVSVNNRLHMFDNLMIGLKASSRCVM